MQEKLQLLKELQGLDLELINIRESRKEIEKEQALLNADLERIQSMVSSLVSEIEGLQTERRELGRALDQEQDNVEKAEGRLPSIKTQKEYVAVLKEVDTAKKLNKEIEDRILAKDSEIEVLERDREEKQQELADLMARVESRQAEISGALGGFDKTLDEKAVQRESLLQGLATQLRKRYQLLLDRRNGIAVVEARNGACLGCNMHLPPQLFNSLYTATEVLTCPHCNRLLYIENGQ